MHCLQRGEGGPLVVVPPPSEVVEPGSHLGQVAAGREADGGVGVPGGLAAAPAQYKIGCRKKHFLFLKKGNQNYD